MIELVEKEFCTGCHACFSACLKNCISMTEDADGFCYPEVNKSACAGCGRCLQACPLLKANRTLDGQKAYAAANKDDAARLSGSSGGIFAILAENILDKGGVVFGAAFDEDLSVKHVFISDKKDIFRLNGSKYVQSGIGEAYRNARDFLNEGKMVLFSGTPCQISGLKAYLDKEYENLFCVDLVCHGVPSPKVWRKYVGYREEKAGAPVTEISFRNKSGGWKKYLVCFKFKNSEEYRSIYDKDLFMQAYLNNICLRPSCYNCCFKSLDRDSDITLADFWGIEELLPVMDDDKGTSLVLINSKAGKGMLEEIKDLILYEEVDISKAISYNSAAIESVKRHKKRKSFFKQLDKRPFDKLVEKYCGMAFDKRVKKRLKLMLNYAKE
ncbi:MAG: (4Fe-4S)-binding protein [Clostridiales bacterium]|nr:(4Fe-4S)-binding protein [Clostridiales bacterium]